MLSLFAQVNNSVETRTAKESVGIDLRSNNNVVLVVDKEDQVVAEKRLA